MAGKRRKGMKRPVKPGKVALTRAAKTLGRAGGIASAKAR